MSGIWTDFPPEVSLRINADVHISGQGSLGIVVAYIFYIAKASLVPDSLPSPQRIYTRSNNKYFMMKFTICFL